MTDLLLLYRACGAECRDDYLRHVAHDNGLPLACVRTIADRLGERQDFGMLLRICEARLMLARRRSKTANSWSADRQVSVL
jgi:hypothetical protein